MDSPQVKRYLISSTKVIVHKLPHEDIRKQENIQIGQWQSVAPNLPFRNKTPVPVVKNDANTDTNVF